MKITRRLLGQIYPAFSRDSEAEHALTLNHDSGLIWTVADRVLTTDVSDDRVNNLRIDLTGLTLASLVAEINTHAGYNAVLGASRLADLGAAALLDGSGTPSVSNGDHIYAYRSINWAIVDTFATQIQGLRDALVHMREQLYLHTARADWLSLWGTYFVGRRRQSETDNQLLARVRASVAKIYTNNRALESLVSEVHGTRVTIADIPHGDNGAYAFSTLPDGRYIYGDPANENPLVCAMAVQFGANADCAHVTPVMATVNRYRAAGTVAIAVSSAGLLHTNTPGEAVNDGTYVLGPFPKGYTAINCP